MVPGNESRKRTKRTLDFCGGRKASLAQCGHVPQIRLGIYFLFLGDALLNKGPGVLSYRVPLASMSVRIICGLLNLLSAERSSHFY